MSYDSMKGTPMAAALIVLGALVLLGVLHFAFSGSVVLS